MSAPCSLASATGAFAGPNTYVNPVIAVFLGWTIADEILTSKSLCAAAIIIAGVMIILIRPQR